ncbi:hypothetical protein HDK77DRAFT_423713 [Phyllosticta capitalensis]
MATIHQCHLEAANTPAECSPTASKPPLECQLEVSNAPVIAEWRFDEGAPSTFFGSKLGNAGTRVVADIRLNPSRSTALFDIRVPVELKAFARTTYLHLLIDPVNVQAIVESRSIPDAVQSPFVGNNTSGHVIGLEFEMTKPISLLGPATARVPKNKKARGALERLKSLAQVAKFTLYVPSQFLSHSQTQQLSAALISGHKYHADWPEFKRMYGGKGAVLLQWDSLETATAPDDASPPSYDQIGPAPPLALESKSSLKKPRRDLSPEAEPSTKRVKFAPANAPGDTEEDEDEEHNWKRRLQDEIRALRGEVKTLREEARSSPSASQVPKAVSSAEPTAASVPAAADSTPATEEPSTSLPRPLDTRIDTLEDRVNTLGDQLSRLISDTESARASNTQQIADLKKHFDERVNAIEYMLDFEVHDARRDAELGLDEAEDRWEEWRVGAKADLESFVAEEMAEVEESIKQSLRAATVYLDFE